MASKNTAQKLLDYPTKTLFIKEKLPHKGYKHLEHNTEAPPHNKGSSVHDDLKHHKVRLLGRYLNSATEAKKIRDLCHRATSEHIKRTRRTVVPGPVRLTKDQNAHIVALYQAGRTPTQIATELGTTEWTVHHRLNRNGIERRPIGMTSADIEEALRLNDEGVPIMQLAERFNRSWKAVAKELRNARARGSRLVVE